MSSLVVRVATRAVPVCLLLLLLADLVQAAIVWEGYDPKWVCPMFPTGRVFMHVRHIAEITHYLAWRLFHDDFTFNPYNHPEYAQFTPSCLNDIGDLVAQFETDQTGILLYALCQSSKTLLQHTIVWLLYFMSGLQSIIFTRVLLSALSDTVNKMNDTAGYGINARIRGYLADIKDQLRQYNITVDTAAKMYSVSACERTRTKKFSPTAGCCVWVRLANATDQHKTHDLLKAHEDLVGPDGKYNVVTHFDEYDGICSTPDRTTKREQETNRWRDFLRGMLCISATPVAACIAKNAIYSAFSIVTQHPTANYVGYAAAIDSVKRHQNVQEIEYECYRDEASPFRRVRQGLRDLLDNVSAQADARSYRSVLLCGPGMARVGAQCSGDGDDSDGEEDESTGQLSMVEGLKGMVERRIKRGEGYQHCAISSVSSYGVHLFVTKATLGDRSPQQALLDFDTRDGGKFKVMAHYSPTVEDDSDSDSEDGAEDESVFAHIVFSHNKKRKTFRARDGAHMYKRATKEPFYASMCNINVLLTVIHHLMGNHKFASFLASGVMAERGVSVKTLDHTMPLTDVLLVPAAGNSLSSTIDSLVQYTGRACSVEVHPLEYEPILWIPPEERQELTAYHSIIVPGIIRAKNMHPKASLNEIVAVHLPAILHDMSTEVDEALVDAANAYLAVTEAKINLVCRKLQRSFNESMAVSSEDTLPYAALAVTGNNVPQWITDLYEEYVVVRVDMFLDGECEKDEYARAILLEAVAMVYGAEPKLGKHVLTRDMDGLNTAYPFDLLQGNDRDLSPTYFPVVKDGDVHRLTSAYELMVTQKPGPIARRLLRMAGAVEMYLLPLEAITAHINSVREEHGVSTGAPKTKSRKRKTPEPAPESTPEPMSVEPEAAPEAAPEPMSVEPEATPEPAPEPMSVEPAPVQAPVEPAPEFDLGNAGLDLDGGNINLGGGNMNLDLDLDLGANLDLDEGNMNLDLDLGADLQLGEVSPELLAALGLGPGQLQLDM